MAASRAAAGLENILAPQAPPLSSRLGSMNKIKCGWELVAA